MPGAAEVSWPIRISDLIPLETGAIVDKRREELSELPPGPCAKKVPLTLSKRWGVIQQEENQHHALTEIYMLYIVILREGWQYIWMAL